MSVEKSDEIKERINLIVAVPDKLVPNYVKFELLLIILGYKKGTVITLDSISPDTNKIMALLVDSGFEVKPFASQRFAKPGYLDILVSDSVEMIKKMETLTIFDEQEWGDIYGYPKTAVDAFVNCRPRLDGIPEEVVTAKDVELLFFAGFVLSRDNWRSELEVVRNWFDEVGKYAPDFLELRLSELREVFKRSK